jgi:exosortase family protein XrtF
MAFLAPPSSVGRDALVRFLLIAVALFIGWQVLYALVIHPWGVLDHWLIDRLAQHAGWILTAFGYTLLPDLDIDTNRYLGVQGGTTLWIGDRCDGLSVMVVFMLFIAAFPGPWKHKPWFMLAGTLVIHVVNAVRVAALCVVATVDYELFNFQHDYTFQVVVYGCVVLLWFLWVKRFAPLPVLSRE